MTRSVGVLGAMMGYGYQWDYLHLSTNQSLTSSVFDGFWVMIQDWPWKSWGD